MSEKENIRQISYFNRQPSLHAHSAPTVKYVPSDDTDHVIRVSPLTIEPMNMD